MEIDGNSLISGAIGAFCGAIVSLITAVVVQRKNWNRQDEKENTKRQAEEEKLFEKFFMELNYNKRRVMCTIESENYTLSGLDNAHWKNFIYSRASQILLKNKTLIDALATLDSMIDQTNNLAHYIKELEIAKICNQGHSVITSSDTKKLRLSLQQYAKNELLPIMENAISELEKIYKSS